MRKRKKGIKLSRGQKARKALFRSLTRALVENGSIETTEAKAGFIENKVSKLINLAKEGSINSKRRVYSLLGNDRKVADEIFEIANKNFTGKSGGFIRIVRLPERKGDGARLVKIEWAKKPTTDSSSAGKTSKKRKNKKLVANKKKSK